MKCIACALGENFMENKTQYNKPEIVEVGSLNALVNFDQNSMAGDGGPAVVIPGFGTYLPTLPPDPQS